MNEIASFDLSPIPKELFDCHFTLACDVENTLLGSNGSTFVYAKQKGASTKDIKQLEKGAKNFISLLNRKAEKNIHLIKGSGAAGGTPCAFLALFPTNICKGIEIALEVLGIEKDLKEHVDFVITGEGKIDSQTLCGKTVMGISNLCKKYNTKVIAVCGRKGKGWKDALSLGIDKVYEVSPLDIPPDEIKQRTPKNLYLTMQKLADDLNRKQKND